MVNTFPSSSLTDHVHPDVAIAEQEISHQKLLNVIVKGTPIVTGAALATACAYVGLNNPESKEIFPVCGFYAVTGFYCPGCGMTRAMHSVLHGNIVRAIQYNLVLVLALPVLMYLYMWWMTWSYTGKELPKIHVSRRVTWIALGLVAVFVVGRNFPGAVPHFFTLGRA